jgi:hypothetical protein
MATPPESTPPARELDFKKHSFDAIAELAHTYAKALAVLASSASERLRFNELRTEDENNCADDFGIQLVGIAKNPSGWTLWSDLRTFCKEQEIDLSLMIVNLDFSALGD